MIKLFQKILNLIKVTILARKALQIQKIEKQKAMEHLVHPSALMIPQIVFLLKSSLLVVGEVLTISFQFMLMVFLGFRNIRISPSRKMLKKY